MFEKYKDRLIYRTKKLKVLTMKPESARDWIVNDLRYNKYAIKEFAILVEPDEFFPC